MNENIPCPNFETLWKYLARSRWRQVGKDGWHRHNNLSGIMVYFENCLVSSYARGEDLPSTVPAEESGCLAIVSFSGLADKRLFHPNPTKVPTVMSQKGAGNRRRVHV